MLRLIHKVAIVFMSLATLAVFAAFFLYPANRILIAVIALVAAGTVALLAKRLPVHRSFWELYFFVEIGLFVLFSVVELPVALFVVVGIATLGAGVLASWGKLAVSPTAFLREKPIRRAVVMLVALAVFAYSSFGQAVLTLFPNFSPMIVHTLLGVLVSYGAYLAWSLYYDGSTIEFLIPAMVLFCLGFEMSLVISFLSIGYLAAGFIMSWLWYIAQLFIRFHFGKRDIIWRKQKWFLGINVALMIVFVYTLRFL